MAGINLRETADGPRLALDPRPKPEAEKPEDFADPEPEEFAAEAC
jgi:hypothetical protein